MKKVILVIACLAIIVFGGMHFLMPEKTTPHLTQFFSKEHKEILGSRLMGGGFGGCTINLILESFIDEYINKISDEYYKKYSINLESIIGSISDGICVV